MTRWFPVLALAFLLPVACSTSKPASPPASIDPVTDPSAVGAIDEAARQASAEGEAAARTGRRIGRVAGVLAAVLGGPQTESVDDVIDRYRRTRDAVEDTAVAIGATKGAVAGAKRGHELDLQFAELDQIEGLEVTRPFPDQIDIYLATSPSPEILARIAAVFAGRETRDVLIEAAGDASLDLRESLIDLGLPPSSLSTHRNDTLSGIVLRIRYQE